MSKKSPAVIFVTAKGCGGCETFKRGRPGSPMESDSPRDKIAGSELDLTFAELDKLVAEGLLSMYYWVDLDSIGQSLNAHFGGEAASRKKVHPQLNDWIGFYPQIMIFEGDSWFNKDSDLRGSVMGGQMKEGRMVPGANNFDQTDKTQLRNYDVVNWIKTNIPKYYTNIADSQASSSISPRVATNKSRGVSNGKRNNKKINTAGSSLTISQMSSSSDEDN